MSDPSAPALALYRGAFEASAVAMAISTQRGRIVDVNPAFLRLFGLRRDEAVGHTSAELGLVPAGEPGPEELAALTVAKWERGDGAGVFQRSLRSRAGQTVRLTLFASVIDLEDEPMLVSSFVVHPEATPVGPPGGA
jgi:PAS domain S-box-containing protein